MFMCTADATTDREISVEDETYLYLRAELETAKIKCVRLTKILAETERQRGSDRETYQKILDSMEEELKSVSDSREDYWREEVLRMDQFHTAKIDEYETKLASQREDIAELRLQISRCQDGQSTPRRKQRSLSSILKARSLDEELFYGPTGDCTANESIIDVVQDKWNMQTRHEEEVHGLKQRITELEQQLHMIAQEKSALVSTMADVLASRDEVERRVCRVIAENGKLREALKTWERGGSIRNSNGVVHAPGNFSPVVQSPPSSSGYNRV